jgi:hypothetical protein
MYVYSPTFNRVLNPDDKQVIAIADLCVKFGWSRIAIIATTDVYASGLATTFGLIAPSYGIDIIVTSLFDPGVGSVAPNATDEQIADIRTTDVIG